MNLSDFQQDPKWSVHIEENCHFPQYLEEEDGTLYPSLFPMVQLRITVWLIPREALRKTDTPAGPVWDAKVRLDEYRCYRFLAPAILLTEQSPFDLLDYRHKVNAALRAFDLSPQLANRYSTIKLYI